MKKLYAIFAALLVVGMMGATADLEARSCKRVRTFGKGTSGLSKTLAKAAARVNWRKNVRLRYSAKWTIWSKAKKKSSSCYKSKGKYKCTVRAYACR